MFSAFDKLYVCNNEFKLLMDIKTTKRFLKFSQHIGVLKKTECSALLSIIILKTLFRAVNYTSRNFSHKESMLVVYTLILFLFKTLGVVQIQPTINLNTTQYKKIYTAPMFAKQLNKKVFSKKFTFLF